MALAEKVTIYSGVVEMLAVNHTVPGVEYCVLIV